MTYTQRKISLDEAKDAFHKGFATGLNINLEPLILTRDQENEVTNLAKDKYEADEWNFMR